MKQVHDSIAGVLLSLLAMPAFAAVTVNGDGTVTDGDTGLVWDRCAWGRTWNAGSGACDAGTAETFAWRDALSSAVAANAARHLGHDDWRLPSKNELESLVDIGAAASPVVDPVFPWPYSGTGFWSSSTYLPTPASAWRVDFLDGSTLASAKGSLLRVRLVRGGQSAAAFDLIGDITPPVLSHVGVSGTGQTGTTLAATCDEAATGYWIVVARGAPSPTADQIRAGAGYGTATVLAHGSAPMTAGVAVNFAVSGLAAGTAYDLYLVAQDGSLNANYSGVAKVPFSTLVQTPGPTYAITTTANPPAGGTASCTPNPVSRGGSSSCTASPNPGYTFENWSGDCAGTSCILANVTATRNVTANFAAAPATFGPIATRKPGVTATLAVTGCHTVAAARFIDAPAGGHSGTTFPYGLLDFTLSGCGGNATVRVTYSETLPAGTFYKEVAGAFTTYPATVAGNGVTFALTDNGSGDDNALVGTIHDPSGLGVEDARPIPALGAWGLTLLSLLLGLASVLRSPAAGTSRAPR